MSDERRIVRLASARTLAILDARQSARALFERSQKDGLEMAQIVEPALARWDFGPVREIWRNRLEHVKTDRKRCLLAIRGLAEVKDDQAADALLKIAVDATRSPELRLAAADALGRIRSDGLEDAARELADRESRMRTIDRLVAAKCLAGHSSERARRLLVELAQDDEPSVAAIALNRLLEVELDLILPVAESALAKGDVNVRFAVAKALVARPSATTLAMLGDLMGDLNPKLRTFASKSLFDLAESPGLRPQVIQQGVRMVQDERWQALEQSLWLLAKLDQEEQSDRFIELLRHDRPEVYVTAAWGLRKLAIDETLAPLLKFAKQRDKEIKEATGLFDAEYFVQLVSIFEFFGQKKYAPADSFLRTFVPKESSHPETRSAAIWALGYIHEGKPDAGLVKALEGRIRDTMGMMAEHDLVRRMSVVAIGRMKASEALPTLKSYSEPGGIDTDVGYACAWSIKHMTGKPFKKPVPAIGFYGNFFLEPVVED
jgi:HEAT repeat protein